MPYPQHLSLSSETQPSVDNLWLTELGPSDRTCSDVMVEKHYRSVLSRGVLDPFFAAHTKVSPALFSIPARSALKSSRLTVTRQ